jgi:rhomboid family GlyGly-CTERM serine protease
VASLAVWAAGPVAGAALQWDAALWTGRPWTLFTSAFVHLSGAHLLANLLALGALAILGWSLGAGQPACLALLVAWPLGTLALQAWPQVTQYSGLSGLVHAAVAVLWAHAAVRGKAYPLSFVLFVALVFKLLIEHAWATPLAFDLDWGFNVVYAAHLCSTLAGAVCGLVAAIWTLWPAGQA